MLSGGSRPRYIEKRYKRPFSDRACGGFWRVILRYPNAFGWPVLGQDRASFARLMPDRAACDARDGNQDDPAGQPQR